MSQIILDFGSGNTCQNHTLYVKRMIDELKEVDTGKHEIIIKWQLFNQATPNIPLERYVFNYAYHYAKSLGYKTTASVFDRDSLWFLLQYDVPFIKIANNRELDYLIGEIPRKTPVYCSVNADRIVLPSIGYDEHIVYMSCVSKYPADISEYGNASYCNLSDHTTDFQLWVKYQPNIIEWHYKLKDSTGLDAGPFARTPEQLKEVL